jgi:hypothetical protein
MALPLAIAAIAATVGGGAAFASVLPDNPIANATGAPPEGGNGIDIPWIALAAFVGFIIVLRTFVSTATQELL